MAPLASVLEYRLRFWHFWAFNCCNQFLSISTQILFLIWSVAFAAVVALDPEENKWLLALTLGVASYVVMWLLQCAFNAVYLYSRRNRVLTAHALALSETGLTDSTSTYETLNRWSGLLRVREFGFLTAVHTSPFEAILVPRSAFADTTACSQWAAQVRQLMR